MKAWGTMALALALAGAGGLALAQPPPQLGPSSSGPIDITADNGSYDNATCESTWSGAAEVLQGRSRLRANVIHAFMRRKAGAGRDQAACGQAERIEADGNVFYVTPDEVARGDHAVYEADANRIVMTGDVIVVQGKNVVHGDRMTINTRTREVQMVSDAKGRGTPGRVRGVFYPGASGSAGLLPAAP